MYMHTIYIYIYIYIYMFIIHNIFIDVINIILG